MLQIRRVIRHPKNEIYRFLLQDALMATQIGRQVFRDLSEPYLGGHSLEACVAKVEEQFLSKGVRSTCDILGEEATSQAEAEEYINGYRTLVDLISAANSRNHASIATISVKPSAINPLESAGGYFKDRENLLPALKQVVGYAHDHSINVTIDMEDHRFTYDTLSAAQALWRRDPEDGRSYDNVGIVLQARLNRTSFDIAELFSNENLDSYAVPADKIRVRMCIGIYLEPKDIATRKKKVAKKRMEEDVINLLHKGVYVEIATHDLRLLSSIQARIEMYGFQKNQYEFQFLEGVENIREFEKNCIQEGIIVRRYEPGEMKENAGEPYMIRRLIANPGIIWNGGKNLYHRITRHNGDL